MTNFFQIENLSNNSTPFIDPNHVVLFDVKDDGTVELDFVDGTRFLAPMNQWVMVLGALGRDGMQLPEEVVAPLDDVNATDYIDNTTDDLQFDLAPAEVQVQGYSEDYCDGHAELAPEEFAGETGTEGGEPNAVEEGR